MIRMIVCAFMAVGMIVLVRMFVVAVVMIVVVSVIVFAFFRHFSILVFYFVYPQRPPRLHGEKSGHLLQRRRLRRVGVTFALY